MNKTKNIRVNNKTYQIDINLNEPRSRLSYFIQDALLNEMSNDIDKFRECINFIDRLRK